jgi:hypothetical protein
MKLPAPDDYRHRFGDSAGRRAWPCMRFSLDFRDAEQMIA